MPASFCALSCRGGGCRWVLDERTVHACCRLAAGHTTSTAAKWQQGCQGAAGRCDAVCCHPIQQSVHRCAHLRHCSSLSTSQASTAHEAPNSWPAPRSQPPPHLQLLELGRLLLHVCQPRLHCLQLLLLQQPTARRPYTGQQAGSGLTRAGQSTAGSASSFFGLFFAPAPSLDGLLFGGILDFLSAFFSFEGQFY